MASPATVSKTSSQVTLKNQPSSLHTDLKDLSLDDQPPKITKKASWWSNILGGKRDSQKDGRQGTAKSQNTQASDFNRPGTSRNKGGTHDNGVAADKSFANIGTRKKALSKDSAANDDMVKKPKLNSLFKKPVQSAYGPHYSP